MESAVNNHNTSDDLREESIFAGVVFHNIQEVYIPEKDIRCCYSIKPSVSTTANDWIGLYKVGWQSPKDFLCYEYSPVLEGAQELTVSMSSQNSVVFRGSKLPSEESEFYQFCYVTSSGDIRGASYPFQISFSKPGDLQCSEEQDESGDVLLIVKNRTTLLEESLAKAYDENASLKECKEKAEAECFKFQDMVLNLEAKKDKMALDMEMMREELEKAKSEKEELEKTFKNTDELFKKTKDGLKTAEGKLAEVEKQLDNERLLRVQTSSDQQKFEEVTSQLAEDIAHKDGVIQTLLDTIDKNVAKIAALEREIKNLKNENAAQKQSYNSIVIEMEKTGDSFKKSKQAQATLETSLTEQFEQVSKLEADNRLMKEELAANQKEIEDLSRLFGEKQLTSQQKHQQEIGLFEKRIETMSSELDECHQNLEITKKQYYEALSALETQQELNQQQVKEHNDSAMRMQEQLNQERALNNSLSSASDRQVNQLEEQLNCELSKNFSSLMKIEEQAQKIKHLEECVTLKEKDIKELQNKIETQLQQLEASKKRESESLQSSAAENGKPENFSSLQGPYFALQTAHSQLRKQYLQAKKDSENLWRQKADLKRQLTTFQSGLPESDMRFQMANMKKQIEDLRIRLNMGAEAYKAKFKECQKFEKQLKKAQKDSNGQSRPQNPSSETEFENRNLKQSLENEKTSAAALKKSLENYRADTQAAKEELLKVNKENALLRQENEKLVKESCISSEETQKRLIEDKQLQSHIECLHNQLETKTETLKEVEKTYQEAVEENKCMIAALSRENEELQDALEKAGEQNTKALTEKENLLEEKRKQAVEIEELRQMVGLVDSVAKHNASIANQENAVESAPMDETSRGPSPSAPPTSIQNGRQCPMCQIFFPPNCLQHDFEQHVNSHFKE